MKITLTYARFAFDLDGEHCLVIWKDASLYYHDTGKLKKRLYDVDITFGGKTKEFQTGSQLNKTNSMRLLRWAIQEHKRNEKKNGKNKPRK